MSSNEEKKEFPVFYFQNSLHKHTPRIRHIHNYYNSLKTLSTVSDKTICLSDTYILKMQPHSEASV